MVEVCLGTYQALHSSSEVHGCDECAAAHVNGREKEEEADATLIEIWLHDSSMVEAKLTNAQCHSRSVCSILMGQHLASYCRATI